MLPKVSKGFRAIFVAVMCVVCGALCVLAVRLTQQSEQLRLTQLQLDASLARLKLQQTQRAQIDVDLPETLAQLQAVQPEADAASAREQELRAQRKALRSENAELAASPPVVVVKRIESSFSAVFSVKSDLNRIQ